MRRITVFLIALLVLISVTYAEEIANKSLSCVASSTHTTYVCTKSYNRVNSTLGDSWISADLVTKANLSLNFSGSNGYYISNISILNSVGSAGRYATKDFEVWVSNDTTTCTPATGNWTRLFNGTFPGAYDLLNFSNSSNWNNVLAKCININNLNGVGGQEVGIDEIYVKNASYATVNPVPVVNGNIISTIPNTTTIYLVNNNTRLTPFRATANITRDYVNATLYVDGVFAESILAMNSTVYQINFTNRSIVANGTHYFNFTLIHQNGTNVTSALYSFNVTRLNFWSLEIGERNGSIVNLEQIAGQNLNNTNHLFFWNETSNATKRRLNISEKIRPILANSCVCDGCAIVENKCYIPFYFSSFSNGSITYINLSVVPFNTTFTINQTYPLMGASIPLGVVQQNVSLNISIYNQTNLLNLTNITIYVYNSTGALLNYTFQQISGISPNITTPFETTPGVYATYLWNATVTGFDYDNNITVIISGIKNFTTTNGLYSTNIPNCVATLSNVTCTGFTTNTTSYLDTILDIYLIDFIINATGPSSTDSDIYGRINTTAGIFGRNFTYRGHSNNGAVGTDETYVAPSGVCVYGPYTAGTGTRGHSSYFLMSSNLTSINNVTVISNSGNGGNGGRSDCGFCDDGGTECEARGGHGAVGGNNTLIIQSTNSLFIDGLSLSANIGTSGSGGIGRAECTSDSSYECVGIGGDGASETNGTFIIQSFNNVLILNNTIDINASNGNRGDAGDGQVVGSFSTATDGNNGAFKNTSAIFSAYNLSFFSRTNSNFRFGNGLGFSSGNGYFLTFRANESIDFNGIQNFTVTWSLYNSTNTILFTNPLVARLRWINTSTLNPFYIYYNSSTITYVNDSTFNRQVIKLNDKSVNLLMGSMDYWGLDELSGSNVSNANRSTNYGNATGTVIISGKLANARSFQTAGDNVTFATQSLTANNGEKTISMWVKNLTFPIASVNKSSLFSTAQNFTFGVHKVNSTSCALYVSYLNASDIMLNTSGFACSQFNDWTHVAMAYDGINTHRGLKLYLNGQELDINNNTNNIFFAMGGTNRIGLNSYAGIDEVGVWNRWLNSEEIKKLYYFGNALPYPYIEGDLIIARLFQDPADITATNLFGIYLNISYNITPTNVSIATLNGSSVYFNYTLEGSRTNFVFVNGTTQTYPRQNNVTKTNVTSNYFFRLDEEFVYPGSYNRAGVNDHDKNHTFDTIGNGFVSIELLNITNTTQFNFMQLMANATTTSSASLLVYYCSDLYGFNETPGDAETVNRCTELSNILATITWSDTEGNSTYITVPYFINTTTGKINNVSVTSKSYFILDKNGGFGEWQYGYVPNLTRVGAMKTGNVVGTTWTNQTYTIDAHVHQISLADIFKYQACALSSLGNLSCSYYFQDAIGIASISPTSPFVYMPNGTVVSGQVSINYTAANSLSSTGIAYYNISLIYAENQSTVIPIINNTLNLGYNWNSTNTTIQNGVQYKVKVEAIDNTGLNSFGLSSNFTINNPASFWVNVGSRKGTHWFPTDADLNWRGNFSGQTVQINFTTKINTILSSNCSCLGCKINNYTCNIPISFESYFINMTVEYSAINITAMSNISVTPLYPNNNSDWSINELDYFKCEASTRNILRLDNVTFVIYNSTEQYNKTTIATNGTSNITTYHKVMGDIGNYTWHCIFSAIDYNNNQSQASNSNRTFEITGARVYDFRMILSAGINQFIIRSNMSGNYTQYGVQPRGQTSSLGIFTATNNVSINLTAIARINETNSHFIIKTSGNNNYSQSIALNTSYSNLFNFTAGNVTGVWLWVDYINISPSIKSWFPGLYYRGR